jgi:hypothetical protein
LQAAKAKGVLRRISESKIGAVVCVDLSGEGARTRQEMEQRRRSPTALGEDFAASGPRPTL